MWIVVAVFRTQGHPPLKALQGDAMTSAFHVPATILIGGGARREVVAQLQRFKIQRVLVCPCLQGGNLGEGEWNGQ